MPRAGARSGPKPGCAVYLKESSGFIGLLRRPARGKPAHYNSRQSLTRGVGEYVGTHLVRIHAGVDQRIQGAVDHRR